MHILIANQSGSIIGDDIFLGMGKREWSVLTVESVHLHRGAHLILSPFNLVLLFIIFMSYQMDYFFLPSSCGISIPKHL